MRGGGNMMRDEAREYLTSEVIGYLRATGNVNYADHLFMFKSGISFLSGREPDLKVADAIDIVNSAVDYVLEHDEEIK